MPLQCHLVQSNSIMLSHFMTVPGVKIIQENNLKKYHSRMLFTVNKLTQESYTSRQNLFLWCQLIMTVEDQFFQHLLDMRPNK